MTEPNSRPALWCGVVTLFPTMFGALTDVGITGRACKRGQVEVHCFNPRDFATDNHRSVDDRPFGGGPGMVMLIEPVAKAIQAAKAHAQRQGFSSVPVIYLSPQGQRFSEQLTQRWIAEHPFTEPAALILLCGRYEGIDERVIERCVDYEWSIGDYVLTGGELPAMVVMDSLIRRLPTVMGDDQSAVQDSFVDGLLDCPHYTRPVLFDGSAVPPVLLSGHHAQIEQWRFIERYRRTMDRRPELIAKFTPTSEQTQWLEAERLLATSIQLNRRKGQSAD